MAGSSETFLSLPSGEYVPDDAPEATKPSTALPLLQLRHIGKLYGNGTIALEKVDLAVAEGEFLAVLGPSGCGKSTLLRIIAGLSEASTGSIDWHWRPATAADRRADRIGFVFQEPTLLPWATVFENVFLPLKLTGAKRRHATARVTAALALVGLEQFSSAYPRELSGGMKMRASIARALVVEPRILLMDEPFAALDEMTRFRLNDDLLRLWRAKKLSVIFVTHSVFEAAYLSSRVVVMTKRPGRIVGEFANAAAHPRGDAFRNSTAYYDLCRRASTELRRVTADGGDPA